MSLRLRRRMLALAVTAVGLLAAAPAAPAAETRIVGGSVAPAGK